MISLVTVDAILAATLGAVLTPVGSLALIVARRLWQGSREKKKVKGAIESELYEAAQEIAAKIRLEIETSVNSAITAMTDMYTSALSLEMDSIKVPLQIIDDTVEQIREHQSMLEQLNFE